MDLPCSILTQCCTTWTARLYLSVARLTNHRGIIRQERRRSHKIRILALTLMKFPYCHSAIISFISLLLPTYCCSFFPLLKHCDLVIKVNQTLFCLLNLVSNVWTLCFRMRCWTTTKQWTCSLIWNSFNRSFSAPELVEGPPFSVIIAFHGNIGLSFLGKISLEAFNEKRTSKCLLLGPKNELYS